jgi:hypothetical protein
MITEPMALFNRIPPLTLRRTMRDLPSYDPPEAANSHELRTFWATRIKAMVAREDMIRALGATPSARAWKPITDMEQTPS